MNSKDGKSQPRRTPAQVSDQRNASGTPLLAKAEMKWRGLGYIQKFRFEVQKRDCRVGKVTRTKLDVSTMSLSSSWLAVPPKEHKNPIGSLHREALPKRFEMAVSKLLTPL
jgi:hypothetical protein